MNKIIIIIVFSFMYFSSTAQLYKKHRWDKKPIYYKLHENEKEFHSVAIKEKYLIQYYATLLGNNIKLFETKHSIIRINSDKGIAKHNRVYIPIRNVIKVIDIKARVLQKDGSIKNLNNRNIKELKDVKNYGGFKIFAIEGVTKDCQLEFIYTLERNYRGLGSVIVQKNYDVREAEVIIRKPFSLSTRIRNYNDFPEMVLKKVQGNKKAYTVTIREIKAMTDEVSGSPEANRMKIAYQVTSGGYSNDNMWDNLESNIQDSYIKIKPKKHQKLVNDYLSFSKDNLKESSIDIINNISEYIHSNYNIIRERNESLSNLKTIYKKKQASELGVIKIYSCLFNYEKIEYQIVLTSDRFNHKFDPSFYSNNNLQIGLFYFPSEQKYLRPEYVNSRINFAPTNTISNKGVFISDKKRAFKKIHIPMADENVVNRTFNISIDTINFLPTISCTHLLNGYRGYYARSAYKYLKNKDLNEFKLFTTVTGIDDPEFINFIVENEDLKLGSKNIPFELKYTYKAESLAENLGNDSSFILNFGKIIGTQTEFYQEAKRVNPVELPGLITYKYSITIDTPKGYEAKGLGNIKINKVKKINNQNSCSFNSDYVIKGNQIIISVKETYNKIHMDLEYYEDYKEVVNSAFDFSKKSILFKKL